MAKGLSVEALAVLSGICAENIILFEAGNGGEVLLADLLLLAEIIDVDIEDIFGGWLL